MQHHYADGHPVFFPRQTVRGPFNPTHTVIPPRLSCKLELSLFPHLNSSYSSHVRGEARNVSLRLHHGRTFRNILTLIPPFLLGHSVLPTSHSIRALSNPCTPFLAIPAPAVSSCIPKRLLEKVGLGLLPALTAPFEKVWECSIPFPYSSDS